MRYLMLNPYALLAAIAFSLVAAPAAGADPASAGVIVMHGKWGSPQRIVNGLADALRDQGFLVASPEMPWSRLRSYDRSVDGADVEIDAEIAKLRNQGAKRIFLVGHSLGAAYALHYASRTTIDGIVAIAPGHRPEVKRIADFLDADVRNARELAASGKGDEMVWFVDFNTGNRRDRIKAGAASFLSYFDPAGPMNMARNVTTVKPGVTVLWMVPTREEQPQRDGVVSLYGKLPPNPRNKFVEPDSDHLQAPAAATPQVIDWIRAVAAGN